MRSPDWTPTPTHANPLKGRAVTADEFLRALATEIGVRAPNGGEAEALLKLAAIAAHSSERIAAPLACRMAGQSGLPLPELLVATRRMADDAA
jgi:hypothetical protein